MQIARTPTSNAEDFSRFHFIRHLAAGNGLPASADNRPTNAICGLNELPGGYDSQQTVSIASKRDLPLLVMVGVQEPLSVVLDAPWRFLQRIVGRLHRARFHRPGR